MLVQNQSGTLRSVLQHHYHLARPLRVEQAQAGRGAALVTELVLVEKISIFGKFCTVGGLYPYPLHANMRPGAGHVITQANTYTSHDLARTTMEKTSHPTIMHKAASATPASFTFPCRHSFSLQPGRSTRP